jgi:DNA-binding XRE family transcriptional regulator
MITPTQMRAARAMLDVPQGHVAEHLGIAANTLSKIESGQSDVSMSRMSEIQRFYEREGIAFVENEGVKWNKNEILISEGSQGFSAFLDDVHSTALEVGTKEKPCEVFLSNVAHDNWVKWMGADQWKNHADRMTKDKEVMDVRIIVKENDWNFPAKDYSQYKWFPREFFNEQSFYSYHDRLVFLNFTDDNVEIMMIKNKNFAVGYRTLFTIAWDNFAIEPNQKSTVE